MAVNICRNEAPLTNTDRGQSELVSVLAGEASARFSLGLGGVAAFDARISQLPSPERVAEYFRWRQEDAHRNALNGHGYWLLRQAGESAQAASDALRGLSAADKNELLFRHGINFNELPSWQKRGAAMHWQEYAKPALDPRSGEPAQALRRRLARELELPLGEAYEAYVRRFVV